MSKKGKRTLALLNDPRNRNQLIGDINLINQDEPVHVNRDQGMKVLTEMDELQDFENKTATGTPVDVGKMTLVGNRGSGRLSCKYLSQMPKKDVDL